MQVKQQSLVSSSLKLFFFVSAIVLGGYFINNSIQAKRIECDMFHGVLVKGTCIYPR